MKHLNQFKLLYCLSESNKILHMYKAGLGKLENVKIFATMATISVSGCFKIKKNNNSLNYSALVGAK